MKKYLIIVLAVMFVAPAFALTSPDGSIQAAVQAAMEASAKSLLLPQAMMWLGSFMLIQMLITNIGLLKSGAEIEAMFGKLIGSLMWFGVCIYLLQNGPNFIDSVGTGILHKFMPDWISPGYILTAIGGVVLALLSTVGLTGIMVLGSGSPMLSLVVIVILFTVVAVALGLAMKIFMLKLELGLIVMLSPLSFAFLGINALKDQGIAPFKALISLIYRAILLGVICAAFKEVSTTTEAALASIDWGLDALAWIDKAQIMITSVFAYPMLGYLVYKSDAIASSLASGSTNMGTADVASAAATGAAIGATMAAGAGAVGATPSKIAESMSSVMGRMRGGGGSVSNASSMGTGGATSALPMSPSHSYGPASGETVEMPGPPAFKTNRAGAPMNPDPKANVAGPANPVGGGAAPNSGSGSSAGIGGQNAEQAEQNASKPKQKTFMEHLSGLNNQHIGQEKASTHVSINTHHSD